MPIACAAAAVRSHCAVSEYGPRSITGTTTPRAPYETKTGVPQGSDRWATPTVASPRTTPQAVVLPKKPGPYHVVVCALKMEIERTPDVRVRVPRAAALSS